LRLKSLVLVVGVVDQVDLLEQDKALTEQLLTIQLLTALLLFVRAVGAVLAVKALLVKKVAMAAMRQEATLIEVGKKELLKAHTTEPLAYIPKAVAVVHAHLVKAVAVVGVQEALKL
jgi:hypothetical protein